VARNWGRASTLPAETVARVTKDHASGLTLAKIADALNAEKVATGQGGIFLARFFGA
jgi:hypothetical protein